jgi:hypothetical protein
MTNPPIDASRTIHSQMGTANGLVAILDRSCRDCHSNATQWPWYTQVAPLSWVMASGVAEGRKVVNFSEWGGYSPGLQRTLLAESCDATSSGRMPGAWTYLHSEASLSSKDVETICSAATQAEAHAAGAKQ